jgi:hypothetical protein
LLFQHLLTFSYIHLPLMVSDSCNNAIQQLKHKHQINTMKNFLCSIPRFVAALDFIVTGDSGISRWQAATTSRAGKWKKVKDDWAFSFFMALKLKLIQMILFNFCNAVNRVYPDKKITIFFCKRGKRGRNFTVVQ